MNEENTENENLKKENGSGNQDRDKEIEAKFAELIATPISKEEADKTFAEIDIKRTQLAIVRQKWLSQAEALRQQITQVQQRISMLDEDLLSIELDRAVVFRRALNNVGEASNGNAD